EKGRREKRRFIVVRSLPSFVPSLLPSLAAVPPPSATLGKSSSHGIGSEAISVSSSVASTVYNANLLSLLESEINL
uniref:Uncharacterized protein n=1 Tax=Cucumis melo TaxID=3656 RepID=A0A9I9EE42_CUCME